MDELTADTSKIEVHHVSNRSGCSAIERRLQSWGLDINWVGTEANPVDPVLPIACLYSGSDADPSADRWTDPRLSED
jgi:hypothetical protein